MLCHKLAESCVSSKTVVFIGERFQPSLCVVLLA